MKGAIQGLVDFLDVSLDEVSLNFDLDPQQGFIISFKMNKWVKSNVVVYIDSTLENRKLASLIVNNLYSKGVKEGIIIPHDRKIIIVELSSDLFKDKSLDLEMKKAILNALREYYDIQE